MTQNQKPPVGIEAVLEIVTARRLHQQNANRLDRIGAILDAKLAKDNANTVTGWVDTLAADITAATSAPVFYVDPATGKPFTAIK